MVLARIDLPSFPCYPPHFRVGREEARGMGMVTTRISSFLEEWLGVEGSHLEERRETPKEARWREGMVMTTPASRFDGKM